MKIAFLGKGGSGKSTLATAATNYFHHKGHLVLAIDADHNMDLSFNLGADPKKFIGKDPAKIKRYVGLPDSAGFLEAKEFGEKNGIIFQLSPPDKFTEEVSEEIKKNLFLITAGPHTEIVRSGAHCSHSLAAPLKTYLPLLKLKDNEIVTIDERAGTDPVATGILKAIDLAIIVVEPTIHSVRVASQIAEELTLANVQYVFVANKVTDENKFLENLSIAPIAKIEKIISGEISQTVLEKLFEKIKNM